MKLNTEYLSRCLKTLERSYASLQATDIHHEDYDMYHCAVVKGFELSLEVSGKLLRRALKAFGASAKEVDEMFYKDVFRHAGKRGLISVEAVERWFIYRDNRNNTAHDYGEEFANQTIGLLPVFIEDVKALEAELNKRDFEHHA